MLKNPGSLLIGFSLVAVAMATALRSGDIPQAGSSWMLFVSAVLAGSAGIIRSRTRTNALRRSRIGLHPEA